MHCHRKGKYTAQTYLTKAPHIPHSQASYGVSIVIMLGKIMFCGIALYITNMIHWKKCYQIHQGIRIGMKAPDGRLHMLVTVNAAYGHFETTLQT